LAIALLVSLEGLHLLTPRATEEALSGRGAAPLPIKASLPPELLRRQTSSDCLPTMGAILLTVLTVLLGYGLGKGVPRLVQRSGSLARRSRASQLAFASLLLLPWLIGIALVVQLPLRPDLLLPAIGYAVGMWRGRQKAGL
jgi:hypothetical protein